MSIGARGCALMEAPSSPQTEAHRVAAEGVFTAVSMDSSLHKLAHLFSPHSAIVGNWPDDAVVVGVELMMGRNHFGVSLAKAMACSCLRISMK